jgi:hypothetical protein
MALAEHTPTQSFVFPAFLSWEIYFRHFSLGFVIKHWILFLKLYYSPKLIKNAKTQRASKKCVDSLDTHWVSGYQQVMCRVISKLH